MLELPDKVFFQLDESFRSDDLTRYSLVVEVERKRCRFAILDMGTNRFVGIGDFHCPFNLLLSSIEWLKGSFHSTRIIIANNQATLIPSALFSKDKCSDYLDFNFERSEDDAVLHDWLENLQIYNIYSLPGKLKDEILQAFPQARIGHVSSILIENLFVNFKNLFGEAKIFLNVRDEEFDLTIFKGKSLNYFNSFPFHAPEDLVYYLIFVMEQLNLNPEETPLVLLGDADKKSMIFELLFRYIRNIEFALRCETFGYSYVLNDIPAHQYYTLFNNGQCGS